MLRGRVLVLVHERHELGQAHVHVEGVAHDVAHDVAHEREAAQAELARDALRARDAEPAVLAVELHALHEARAVGGRGVRARVTLEAENEAHEAHDGRVVTAQVRARVGVRAHHVRDLGGREAPADELEELLREAVAGRACRRREVEHAAHVVDVLVRLGGERVLDEGGRAHVRARGAEAGRVRDARGGQRLGPLP